MLKPYLPKLKGFVNTHVTWEAFLDLLDAEIQNKQRDLEQASDMREIGKAQGLSAGLIAYLKNLPDAKNPFAGWAAYLDAIEAQVKRIALGGTAMGTSVGGTIAGGSMTGPIPGSTQVYPGDFGNGGAVGAPISVTVNVGGSVISEGELVDVVRNGLINSSLSGAGSLVARRTGTFATL